MHPIHIPRTRKKAFRVQWIIFEFIAPSFQSAGTQPASISECWNGSNIDFLIACTPFIYRERKKSVHGAMNSVWIYCTPISKCRNASSIPFILLGRIQHWFPNCMHSIHMPRLLKERSDCNELFLSSLHRHFRVLEQFKSAANEC